jgi:hypothetical protein
MSGREKKSSLSSSATATPITLPQTISDETTDYAATRSISRDEELIRNERIRVATGTAHVAAVLSSIIELRSSPVEVLQIIADYSRQPCLIIIGGLISKDNYSLPSMSKLDLLSSYQTDLLSSYQILKH